MNKALSGGQHSGSRGKDGLPIPHPSLVFLLRREMLMAETIYEGYGSFTMEDLTENLCYIKDLCTVDQRNDCAAAEKCLCTHNEDTAAADFQGCKLCKVTVKAEEVK